MTIWLKIGTELIRHATTSPPSTGNVRTIEQRMETTNFKFNIPVLLKNHTYELK